MASNGVGGQVDGGRELSQIEQQNPMLGRLMRKILSGVNTLATNTATSATGETAPPKAPDGVSVKVQGEFMHIQISHAGELHRNVRYFSEITPSTSPGQHIVVDHGASRTSHPILLPTFPDGGGDKTTYTVKSYAQYPSSQPSQPTLANSGTAFTMGGATQMTLLPSTGSGTASSSGQQGGSGLGKVQKRGS